MNCQSDKCQTFKFTYFTFSRDSKLHWEIRKITEITIKNSIAMITMFMNLNNNDTNSRFTDFSTHI